MGLREVRRRCFGLSRAELRAEVETWRQRHEGAERERNEAQARAKQYRREAGGLRNQVHELTGKLSSAERRLALAAEPERRECTKVRLHHQAEAEAWAKQIIADTGGIEGEMNAYRCRTCPRSPVTMQRYWHVGHSDDSQSQRAKREHVERRAGENRAARLAGTTIGQRVDPRVLARLRGERA